MNVDQIYYCSPDIVASMTHNVSMIGKSPPPYQFVGDSILKYSSLMGVFPSIAAPPSIETSMINMISSKTRGMSKGKQIIELSSLSPHEALYDAIQYVSDSYIDGHHLVASDPYHLPYWIDSPQLSLIEISIR